MSLRVSDHVTNRNGGSGNENGRYVNVRLICEAYTTNYHASLDQRLHFNRRRVERESNKISRKCRFVRLFWNGDMINRENE